MTTITLDCGCKQTSETLKDGSIDITTYHSKNCTQTAILSLDKLGRESAYRELNKRNKHSR